MTAPQKSSFKFKFSRGAAAAGLAAVLVGCGGGGSETAQDKGGETPPPPTPIEAAKTALQNAILAANGLPAGTDTATQLAAWQMVKDKAEELQAAVQSNNGSAADLTVATTALRNANTKITPLAQSMERINTASNTLMGAISAYDETASDTEKRTAQEAIKDAAANLITVLQTEGGTTAQVQDATMKQTAADVKIKSLTISITRTDLNEALTALNTDTPTNAQVTAAKEALTDFENAIAHLSDSDKATHSSTITSANTTIGIAETLIAGNDLDDINEENEVWENAIERYTVSTDITNDIDVNLNGTRQLNIELENNAVNIELRNNSNGILIPSTSMTAPTGMTASRFTIQEDRSRGGIATSFSQEAAQRTYADYFFDAYNNPAGTFAPKTNPLLGINGIVVSGNRNGTVTFGNNTDNPELQNDFFGGRPATIAANTSRPITFLGVSGTIACGSTACTVNSNTNGTFSFAGTPTFTPTIPANSDLNDVIVTDILTGSTQFVAFGYWLNSAGAGTNLRHTIDTYAQAFGYNSADPLAPAAVPGAGAGRVGRATYSGGALGFYVLDGQGNGEFAADANLTAQFGDGTGTVSDAEQWMISGTIGNFQSATTPGHDLSGWTIGLAADFGERDDTTNEVSAPNVALNDFIMTNQGNASGEWAAATYGSSAAISTTDNRLDIDAIVGEFDATFSNGHAVGAFGAERD